MSGRDYMSFQRPHQALDPAVLTSDTSSTGVARGDASGIGGIINVGESGDTLSGSVYWTITVQESADDVTYTDVADADIDIFNGETVVTNGIVIDAAAEDDVVISFNYKGHLEYIEVEFDATGTHTNGTPFAVTILREVKLMRG